MKGRVTIRDVAALAGVTPAVVSRLMNQDPTLLILESTKQKIYDAVRATGYKPNPTARALRRNKTALVGVIIVDFTNPFNGQLIRAIQAQLDQRGYMCLVGENEEDGDKMRRLVNLYLEHMVEGLIICTAHENDPAMEELELSGVPYILATRNALNSTAPYIGFDNYQGMCDVMEHLIQLGHRAIAHIAGDVTTTAGRQRIQAYMDSLRRHGIQFEDDYIVHAHWTEKNANACMSQLLALPKPPTAVAVCNDYVAVAALNVIYEHGLRVPEDMSIVGFNNIPASSTTVPPLTTVDTPTMELGARMGELFSDLLAGKREQRICVEVKTRLVVRKSTGPCPVKE